MSDVIKKSNLLKDVYPKIFKELDSEQNKDIDINKLTYGSTIEVWWICKNNHKVKNSVHNRTRGLKNGVDKGTCRECGYDSIRIHDKDTVEKHRNEYVPNSHNNIVGDATEKYVEDLLISMNYVVKNMGVICADSDLCVTIDDINYYIQVKTLVYSYNNAYTISFNGKPSLDGKYEDNMLMVMVNNERNKFALDFAGNIKQRQVIFNDNSNQDTVFSELDLFKNKLCELIPMSCTEFTIRNVSVYKEYLMLQRLENFFIKYNINYKQNTTRSFVKGYINEYKIQAKYLSTPAKGKNTYQISSKKPGGTFNKKCIKRKHEVGDFDYVIVEVSGTVNDKNKYENNFCIIPSTELIKQGVLKSDTCKGKINFSICPPDYPKPHWSKQYWNKIPDEFYPQ